MNIETENEITFYRQLAEHYAQLLLEHQQSTANFLAPIEDGGITLHNYLRLVRDVAESSRQLLSTLPKTPEYLTDETHRFYADHLALIERLQQQYANVLPDLIV